MRISPVLNKKGQVQLLAPAILALVFAAILLVFGLIMTQEIRDTDIVTSSLSISVVNETLTTVTYDGEIIVGANAPGFNNWVVGIVTNASSGDQVQSPLTIRVTPSFLYKIPKYRSHAIV